MPRGIPKKAVVAGDDVKLTIVLHAADYAALEQISRDNYREPRMQASYLLAKVLQEAGKTKTDHVEALLAMRAKQANTGGRVAWTR